MEPYHMDQRQVRNQNDIAIVNTNRYNTNSKLLQLEKAQMKLRLWSGLMVAISAICKNCILYGAF